MSLNERALADRSRVFMQEGHFAESHTWNGVSFVCVPDEETALKRKNNNVVDVSWDNNTREVIVYVPNGNFPGRAVPNEHGFYDGIPMKIMQVNEDDGMLAIALVAYEPKVVSL